MAENVTVLFDSVLQMTGHCFAFHLGVRLVRETGNVSPGFFERMGWVFCGGNGFGNGEW